MIDLMNHVAGLWWNFSVSMFWQVALLIGVIACMDMLLRRHIWPQIRYALWLMVLVKLILPPGLSSPGSVTSVVQPLAQKLAAATPAVQETQEGSDLFRILTAPAPRIEMDYTLLSVPDHAPVTPSLQIVEPVPQSIAPPSLLVRIHWQVYIMGLWLVGAGAFGLWLTARLRRLRQGMPDPRQGLPAFFYEELNLCTERVGLKTAPRVVLTDRMIVPAVMGVWRPVLLMPPGFLRQMSRKDTQHMLLHELSHIKRRDLWVHSTYMILQVIHWYNPLLWLVSRQMHHLRELCCDATVAGLLKEHTMEYRNTLVDIARRYLSRPTEPSLGLLGLFEDSNRLAVRLNWLKKDTQRFRKTRTLLIALLIGVMLACVLPMAQAEDTASGTSTDTKTTSKEVSPPTEYVELAKEIESLKQSVAKEKAKTPLSDPTAVPGNQVSPPGAHAGPREMSTRTLLKQVETLTRQQQAMVQQLEQLKSALHATEAAQAEQTGAKHRLHTQLKHLDTAKTKLKALQLRMAGDDRLKQVGQHLDHVAQNLDHWVDVNGLQLLVKRHTGDLPNQITHRIQTWTDSKEFKQWEKDMKAWEQEVKAWSKQFAKMAEARIKNVKADGTPPDVPMPKMPKMPAMPSGMDHRPEHLVVLDPLQPPSDISAPVQGKVHVLIPHAPEDAPAPVISTVDKLTVSAPTAACEAVPQTEVVGDITILAPDAPHPVPLTQPVVPHAHPVPAPRVRVETRVVTPKPMATVETEVHRVTTQSSPVIVQHKEHTHEPSVLAHSTEILQIPFSEAECKTVALANNVGDITVVGIKDGQCGIQVTITAKAKDASMANDLRNQVHIETSLKGQTFTVTPRTPQNTSESQVTIAFVLKLPQTLNLNLATEVGNINVRNMAGQINCDTNVGDIRAQASVKRLKLNANVGNILLGTSPDTNAKVSAVSNVGKIESKQAFTMTRNGTTGAKGALTLGEGKTRINLNVNVGNIRVGPEASLDKIVKPITKAKVLTTTISPR